MHIWLSNSRSSLTYEQRFFAVICDNLVHRRGAQRVVERFQCFAALATLPWLNQPRLLDPTRLISEIHEAWDELWTLPVQELVVGPATARAAPQFEIHEAEPEQIQGNGAFGRYLAEPLHKLAVLAASAETQSRVRAGTHRELIIGPQRIQSWRIIHGGRSRLGEGVASRPT
jgi:hypothetical protein